MPSKKMSSKKREVGKLLSKMTINEVKHLAKTDCLSFVKDSCGCDALDETYCVLERCVFYKTAQMKEEQTRRIRTRMPDYDPDKKYAEPGNTN